MFLQWGNSKISYLILLVFSAANYVNLVFKNHLHKNESSYTNISQLKTVILSKLTINKPYVWNITPPEKNIKFWKTVTNNTKTLPERTVFIYDRLRNRKKGAKLSCSWIDQSEMTLSLASIAAVALQNINHTYFLEVFVYYNYIM